MIDNNNDFNENQDEKIIKKGKLSKGFYFAFAICLLAMAAAALLTYSSVSDLLNPQSSLSSDEDVTTPTEDKEAQANLNGVEKETKDETQPTQEDITQPVNANVTQEETQAQTDAQQAELIFPADREVVKGYSNSTPVFCDTLKDWRVHNATDFKAEENSAIKSIDNGVVLEITTDNMYGTIISIEHNSGFIANYSNVTPKEGLSQGSVVTLGEELGIIQEIPCEKAQGIHLHLEIIKDDGAIDPMTLFE